MAVLSRLEIPKGSKMPRPVNDAIADLEAWRKRAEQRQLGILFRLEKIEESLRAYMRELHALQEDLSNISDSLDRVEARVE